MQSITIGVLGSFLNFELPIGPVGEATAVSHISEAEGDVLGQSV
jgi:hypothetical protein